MSTSRERTAENAREAARMVEQERDEDDAHPRSAPRRAEPARAFDAAQLGALLAHLTRCAAVVDRLGGIERAERIAAAVGGAP